MFTKKHILVIEGLPASGKTILVNMLEAGFGFTKVNESLGELAGVNATYESIMVKYRCKMQTVHN